MNQVLQSELDEWNNASVEVKATQNQWGRHTAFTSPQPSSATGYYFPTNYDIDAIKAVVKYVIRTSKVEGNCSFIFIFKTYDSNFNVSRTEMVNLGMPKAEAEAQVDEQPLSDAILQLVGNDSAMLFLVVPGLYMACPMDMTTHRYDLVGKCRNLTGHSYMSLAPYQYSPNGGRFLNRVVSPSSQSPYDFIARSSDSDGYLRHYFGYSLPSITSSGGAGLFLDVSVSSWWW